MKINTRRNIFVILSLAIAYSMLFSKVGKADVVNTPANLAGSNLKTEEIVATSSIIFVGKITTLGPMDMMAKGVRTYRSVSVSVSEVLKGNADHEIKITIPVRYEPFNEVTPEVAHAYIFFIKSDAAGRLTTLKLLPATDEGITEVKQLIVAAPAPK